MAAATMASHRALVPASDLGACLAPRIVHSPSSVDTTTSTTVRAASDSRLHALFTAHHASIWRLLRRLGVRPDQLDDAAQEVFWVASRRLDDIVDGREHAFLYGVALRVASSERRRRRDDAVGDPEAFALVADPGPSPEQQLAQSQARAMLDAVLDRMPLELRTVLVLFELEELEVRDIAEIEGIPLGTASSRLRRAREEFSTIARRLRATMTSKGLDR